MNAPIAPPQKGVHLVSGPDDGTSYWQPQPSTGYATVKLHPGNSPINFLSAGIQVLEPGTHVRNHAHQRNDELLFVYEGTGRATIDGKDYALAPGALIAVGRYVEHIVFNDGPVPMKIFWVFAPPGLEDWFAAIGRPRQAGEPMPAPFTRPEDVAEVQKRVKFVAADQLQQG
ncbi:MAG: cupin domain-containing protein [Rhodospirillaceae bacterium]|nr:cupin domain-containing protein [Rhodospirillaceae bacterium]